MMLPPLPAGAKEGARPEAPSSPPGIGKSRRTTRLPGRSANSASPQRVCVLRALQLGDMLCAVPALRSLRAGLPDASITLIGLPWARAFVHRFARYIDDFVEFPGHPAMPEQPARSERWAGFVAAMRRRRFDLAVQMHGSGELTNALLAELGAARCAGFAPADAPLPGASFLRWQPREHEVTRYTRLAHHLGMPDCGSALEWPWLQQDRLAAGAWKRLQERPYVCMHPGARMLSRRWPVARFAQVGEALADAGWTVVVTGAPEEAELAATLTRCMRTPALDFAGRTSLGGLAQLIAHAALIVCNDTGVSHVAAAVGTPSVVVCCGADPERWAPLDHARHRVLYRAVDCRPCMHWICPVGHPCAQGVEVRAVVEEAMRLLPQRAEAVPAAELRQ